MNKKERVLSTNYSNEGEVFETLLELARYLRSPEGCPWDRKQTSLNFAKFASEECEEYIASIEKGNKNEIAEEFGDVLFTLLASAVACETEGNMNIFEALKKTHEKMIRRHNHVFGTNKAETEEEAWDSWQKIKEMERKERDNK
ncbi:MAG: hypothetical protein N3G21_10075 [Candidatus Hydrogenedentes bacterium]|nr:hypothetical protein [Candidatus Hydrogenedentota bacterium]